MTDQENKPVSVRAKRDLVALSEVASAKVDRWIEQINAKKAVNLSRKAFLSWYVENAPENLSNGEINAAIEVFYDTEAHLRQLLRDVKKAKANGQGAGSMELILRTKRQEVKREEEKNEP